MHAHVNFKIIIITWDARSQARSTTGPSRELQSRTGLLSSHGSDCKASRSAPRASCVFRCKPYMTESPVPFQELPISCPHFQGHFSILRSQSLIGPCPLFRLDPVCFQDTGILTTLSIDVCLHPLPLSSVRESRGET